METKAFGELSEAKFQYEAVKFGLIVSKPFGDNAKYDFIVDNGCRLLKVQVKSTSNVDIDGHCSVLAASGKSSKKPYDEGAIDILAVYIGPLDLWYFIPHKEFLGVAKINLYVTSETTRSKYKDFRNNWEIFK